MEQSAPQHEKIRFRRDEIVRLGDLPSACDAPLLTPEPGRRSRAVSVAAWLVGFAVLVLVSVPVGLFVFGIPGAAGDRLLDAAEAAVGRLVGLDVDATMESPTLSIDRSRFLGLEVNDLRVVDRRGDASLFEAGTIRFGVRFVPLFSGKVQLGSASLEDATFDLSAIPAPSGGDWSAALSGPDGLLDPGLVMKAVFGSVHRLFDALDAGATRSISFSNVTIRLPPGLSQAGLLVENATLAREATGFVLKAALRLDGREISLDGSAGREVSRAEAPVTFDATIALARTQFEPASGIEEPLAIARAAGALTFEVSGTEAAGGDGQLRIVTELTDAALDFASGDSIEGSGRVVASFRPAARKIEIERAELVAGRSRIVGHGAFGPAPAVEGEAPFYRYEMVSDGSQIAPGGSPEPDVMLFARVAGDYDPQTMRLTANDIGLRTSTGQANGTAIASFAPGKAPGIEFALSVPEMSVSQAKQLWPWFAAPGAKRWANEKLFGGSIRDSRFSMSVAPGRFGDGKPLGHSEISGYFEVRGTRFDVTGQIPPVRDGVGTVGFQGTDVDISLSSGTVYLPTGRTVAASDGNFIIRRGELPPVIGELDIDVAGNADAVAELASYKPIDAMRHLALMPEDLTGKVNGNIRASIPLQSDVDMSKLGWRVKLAYEDLSIAKPFDGQTITDADGTIDVTPTLAVFKAEAKLNGMPASLDIAEPLGGSDEERLRDVTVTLDDKARRLVMPGLDTFLEGPVKVSLTGLGDDRRLSANLAEARVTVPWVGWSKGPGIPAVLELAYASGEGETRLSDISLKGQSFSLAGSATLSRGSLARAQFDTVKLNRNDDVSIGIKRTESGYSVSVRGNVFDARAVIKQALEQDGIGGARRGGSGPLQVTLDADVAYVSGFQGEALTNVKVSYRGAGAKVLGLKAVGVTRSGAEFSVTDGTQSGQRSVKMASGDAGAVLRFLDLYPHMAGGRISVDLAGRPDATLRGQIDARDFALVDEPRLRSIVASRPQGDSRSLNEAVRGEIDTSRVRFERGSARIEKGDGYLKIDGGVLRGPAIGTTFQGSLYDAKGNMSITGTFMPAYGLNRLFGEIPLLGQILGNGRDRGLIGITYKVAGSAKSPQVQVNPISVIAPGIFRSIFEFR